VEHTDIVHFAMTPAVKSVSLLLWQCSQGVRLAQQPEKENPEKALLAGGSRGRGAPDESALLGTKMSCLRATSSTQILFVS